MLREFFTSVMMVLVSIILTILFVEAVCQLFPQVLPSRLEYIARRTFEKNYGDILTAFACLRGQDTRGARYFQYDAKLGWIGKPDVTGTTWTLDGTYTVTTNALGFRDMDHGAVDPNKTRIVVLGDSFVWGLPIDQDELFPQSLEKELLSDGFNVEVYNLGIAGYGTDQEYLLFKDYGFKYKPDLVILSFFYSNDFWENDQIIAYNKNKPRFILNTHNEIEIDNVPVPKNMTRSQQSDTSCILKSKDTSSSFFRRVKAFLWTRSFLYPEIFRIIGRFTIVERLRVTLGISGHDDKLVKQKRIANQINIRNQNLVTKAILLKMKNAVEEIGSKFLVIVFPGYGYYEGSKKEYVDTIAFFKKELPEISVFDLTPLFEQSHETLYGRFMEHWTKEGANLAASSLNRYIQKEYAYLLQDL